MRIGSHRLRWPFALVLLVIAALSGCGGSGGGATSPPPPVASPPEFRHEGLTGRIVSQIYQHGTRLFAATDEGLYGKTLGENQWSLIGLAEDRVQDLAIVDEQHWLAAVAASGAELFVSPRLMETVNGGANWAVVENDFGGGSSENRGIAAMQYEASSGRLYATEQEALAVSTDLGRTWQLLSGFWAGFSMPKEALNINTARGEVWFAGQNALEQMDLRRHDLASGETFQFDKFLLPSPSTIKGITLDPANPERVLASGEGGILQSFDNGQSWTALLGDVNFRFYFQTALDPMDSDIIYTASWVKETDLRQPLVFETSTDRGTSWTRFELADPDLFGGAWSVRSVIEDDRTVVYLGLFRGGIMKVILPRRE